MSQDTSKSGSFTLDHLDIALPHFALEKDLLGHPACFGVLDVGVEDFVTGVVQASRLLKCARASYKNINTATRLLEHHSRGKGSLVPVD